MRIDLHHYYHQDESYHRLVAMIVALSEQLTRLENRIMHTIDELADAVESLPTVAQGLTAIVTQIAEAIAQLRIDLANALANVGIPPAAQARIDAAFDKVTASTAEIQDDADRLATNLVANTPPPTP